MWLEPCVRIASPVLDVPTVTFEVDVHGGTFRLGLH